MPQIQPIEDDYQPRLIAEKTDRLVVLSGCSGGGKSSLLTELARRGFGAFEEPGRQIVKEQALIGGDALPWANVAQFVEVTVSRSIHHMTSAVRNDRLSFFDRGIIDQVGGLRHMNLPVPRHLLTAAERLRYHERVFVAPPWPEIFANDSERRHSFDEAAASYDNLLQTYESFGYRAIVLPKVTVGARADFILELLGPDTLGCHVSSA